MPATFQYACFNFCLRSEIELRELTPAGEGGRKPVVDVRLGSLPETLDGGSPLQFGIQSAGGDVLLSVAGNARYLVRNGREIVVDPMPGASERNVRLFLLGSALGILCHQRRLLPLHANAVVAQGEAFAFCGHSGAGKSTLAAHFSRQGYEVLCDDVCVISFDEAGAPLAWPGLPRLKLWGDAAREFGHDSTTLDRAIEGHDKYHVPLVRPAAARPVPFRRLYVLARTGDGETHAISRLHGQRAMAAVMEQTYRSHYLRPMGLSGQNFAQCAALLRHVDVYQARRDWGYEVFGEQAALLENHILHAA